MTTRVCVEFDHRGGWLAELDAIDKPSRRFVHRQAAERWAEQAAEGQAEDVEMIVRDAYGRVIRTAVLGPGTHRLGGEGDR